MIRLIITVMALVVMLECYSLVAGADPIAEVEIVTPQPTSSEPFLLGPPKLEGPVIVQARFDLFDVNEIDIGVETFEFTGVLTLKWRDPRSAFEPVIAGVDEKIYQGNYQFNEISPAWYPQLVLLNESGLFESSGVLLRVQPDGMSTLVQTFNANAESQVDMRKYPFDSHRLEAIFEVPGFDKDEILLQVDSNVDSSLVGKVHVPQWTVEGISSTVRDHLASYAGHSGVSSALVLSVDVKRNPIYTLRLVVLPLVVIVLLSFSVFWMARSSLGDRLSVSFIGILTGVAYLLVTSDQLPRISYITLIHGFLNLSFLIMCATVVINIVVGVLDKRGNFELGDRIDRACRWVFPLVYFVLLLIMVGVAFLFF